MASQLACVLVTPYSVAKGRTGGILTRILTTSGCELMASRMFFPGRDLVETYAALLPTESDGDHLVPGLIRDYVFREFSPHPDGGVPKGVLLWLFRGEKAIERVHTAVTHMVQNSFGDCIKDSAGRVVYFEPAALAGDSAESTQQMVQLWSQHSGSAGRLPPLKSTSGSKIPEQRTLVLVKPDNFKCSSVRPGGVLDLFTRAGLSLVGMQLIRMSTRQALEFYGPVHEVLRTRLNSWVGAEAHNLLRQQTGLGFEVPEAIVAELGKLLGPLYGDLRFDNLIRFMSGRSGKECPTDQLDQPGSEPCLAVVFDGIEAVAKCREVLGPTDPSKAGVGTVRREYGTSILANGAHASDSVESAERELAILRLEDQDFTSGFQ